jgi:hypothetical protein
MDSGQKKHNAAGEFQKPILVDKRHLKGSKVS